MDFNNFEVIEEIAQRIKSSTDLQRVQSIVRPATRLCPSNATVLRLSTELVELIGDVDLRNTVRSIIDTPHSTQILVELFEQLAEDDGGIEWMSSHKGPLGMHTISYPPIQSNIEKETLLNQQIQGLSDILNVDYDTASLIYQLSDYTGSASLDNFFANPEVRASKILIPDEPSKKCTVCGGMFPREGVRSLECRHWACMDCWNRYIDSKIRHNCQFVSCLVESCNILVPLKKIATLVNESSYQSYSERIGNTFSSSSRDFIILHHPFMERFLQFDYLNTDTCHLCGEMSHPFTTCEENRVFLQSLKELKCKKISTSMICPYCGVFQDYQFDRLFYCCRRNYCEAYKHMSVTARKFIKRTFDIHKEAQRNLYNALYWRLGTAFCLDKIFDNKTLSFEDDITFYIERSLSRDDPNARPQFYLLRIFKEFYKAITFGQVDQKATRVKIVYDLLLRGVSELHYVAQMKCKQLDAHDITIKVAYSFAIQEFYLSF